MNLQIIMIHPLCGIFQEEAPQTNILFPLIPFENKKVAPITHAV